MTQELLRRGSRQHAQVKICGAIDQGGEELCLPTPRLTPLKDSDDRRICDSFVCLLYSERSILVNRANRKFETEMFHIIDL